MIFYRVHYKDSFAESQGYEFFTTKSKAESAQKKANKENGQNEEIEKVEIRPTKKGVLAALNRWASHPDNG